MSGVLSLKTPSNGLVTLTPVDTATNKDITVPATTGTMVVQDATNTTTLVNVSYSGTLTGGTGVVNIGSGQVYKDASGNVGIGTSSPNQKLHVLGSDGTGFTGATLQNSNANIGLAGVQFSSDTTYSKSAIAQVRENANGAGPLVFYVDSNADAANWSAGDEKMRIDSSGNVGIGTASPSQKLHVNGNAILGNSAFSLGSIELGTEGTGDRNSLIDFHSSGLPNAIDLSARIIRTPGVNGNFVFANLGTGKISWETSGTERMLVNTRVQFVNGSASLNYSGYPITTPNDSIANANRAAGYIEWATDIGAIGTSYFVSDVRKKHNVQPSTTPALPVINSIELIDFDWAEGSGEVGHVNVGVSAQQLKTVNERFVAELSDGTLMVREPSIFPFLIKAIQEQQALIQDLTARLEAVENK